MKIAFCLYGLVGSATQKYGVGRDVDYRIGHHFNKKHIFDQNDDIDTFIHSWSTNHEEGLIETYEPKSYVIEEQIDFKQSSIRQNSFASRWYSLAMANQLKSIYEEENDFKYDWVILSRFDYIFNKDINLKDWDSDNFYISHIQECIDGACVCDNWGMYSDPWFIGNSSDVDLFSTLYENLSSYKGHSHKDTLQHIQKTGLKPRLKHKFYDRFDHYPVRCKYKNCEYIDGEFDMSNFEEYNDVNTGYRERTLN